MLASLRSRVRSVRLNAVLLLGCGISLAGCSETGVLNVPGQPCTNNGDCGPGIRCVEAVCRTECTIDAACPAHEACVLGVCQSGILPDGADCSATRPPACASGYCDGRFCCSGGTCCNSPEHCPAEATSAAECTTPASCQGERQSAACEDHVCTTTTVGDDSACAGSVRSCANNLRDLACTAAVEQPADACPATCAIDDDCAVGFSCQSGDCLPLDGVGDACSLTVACNVGLQCDNDVCCPEAAAQCCFAGDLTCANGLRCDVETASCVESCTDYDDGDCALAPQYCYQGACVDKLVAGELCTYASECASGWCVDGVCCDGACEETCAACVAAQTGAADGTCAPVATSGTDTSPQPLCTAGFVGCDASACACDGLGSGAAHCLGGVGEVCSADAECASGVCDGTCQPGGGCVDEGGPVDLQASVTNCGTCGNACPVPTHASATCKGGVCGRDRCEADYFDLDGATTFGCEAQCAGSICTLPGGGTLELTAQPLHERGLGVGAFASGSSFGGEVQTSATHTNFGILGEQTPPGAEQSSSEHKHRGGFTSWMQQP